MPIISRSRTTSLALRVGELIFACVVAGIIGSYFHHFNQRNALPRKRFIFTEVLAAISILLSLLWLLPFTGDLLAWPLDLLISAAWFTAFAVLFGSFYDQSCGHPYYWSGTTHVGHCNRWKAAEAFIFMSALFWLAGAIVGFSIMYRKRLERPAGDENIEGKRRRWYQGARV